MSGQAVDWRYWRDTVRRGEAIFLVGAGISKDPPSNLPLAAELIESLVRPILTAARLREGTAAKCLAAVSQLRPEVVADVLTEMLGVNAIRPLTAVLRGRPNAWHHYLASAVKHGCSIITTNFDVLIESACATQGVQFTPVSSTRQARKLLGGASSQPILVKVHGSLASHTSRQEVRSLALALRQVARGQRSPMLRLLKTVVAQGPLIVLGYAGRDDFDIAPALRTVKRQFPLLWIVHDDRRRGLVRVKADSQSKDARPAMECSVEWSGERHLLRGRTASVLRLLNARSRSQRSGADSASRFSESSDVFATQGMRAARAILYCLLEARAIRLAQRVIEELRPNFRGGKYDIELLTDRAVMLEKEGADLKAAQLAADQAIEAAERLRARYPWTLARALDQRGVIARRRGQYAKADSFYRAALKVAPKRVPASLRIQIRAHRAVALEYRKRRHQALREHAAVEQYERNHGDLRGRVKTLNNLGIVYEALDEAETAIRHFEESIRLKEQLGDFRGIAQSLHCLGRLHYRRKQYDAAAAAFERSFRLRKGPAKDGHGVAQSLIALSRVAQKRGLVREARQFADQAHSAMLAAHDSRGIAQAQAILRELRDRR